MKCVQTLLVLFYVLIITEIYCETSSEPQETQSEKLCKNTTCVMKCCMFGKILTVAENDTFSCVHYDSSPKFTTFNDNKLLRGTADLTKFDILDGIFEEGVSFDSENTIPYSKESSLYLKENAEVWIESPNSYKRWTPLPNTMYCLEFLVDPEQPDTIYPEIWVKFQHYYEPENPRTDYLLMSCGLLVSCFFLLLVLVVYTLLWELRNLCGRILMAYVSSLFAAFLSLAILRFTAEQNTVDAICTSFTFIIYYFIIASFCWMNVMSCDIWWTFRGYVNARSIHRRGENFKFLMYCLYAWGLPLAMTIMLGVLNSRDMTHVPWFVTPKIPGNACFLEGGEKLLYLYIPMLIIISGNWILFLLTAYSIWRLNRDTAILDSGAGAPLAHRKHQQRYIVYLKLSVVMGLNWAMEVVSFYYPQEKVLLISDLYNILIGVTIFGIFVCKPSIIKKLVKRFKKYKKTHRIPVQTSSDNSSCESSSQEMQTLHICLHPKGPDYEDNIQH